MKLLHLDSSISGGNSVSRAVTASAPERLKAAFPGIEVTYRDLAAEHLPHLTLAALGDTSLVDEFLATDVVLIGAPTSWDANLRAVPTGRLEADDRPSRQRLRP